MVKRWGSFCLCTKFNSGIEFKVKLWNQVSSRCIQTLNLQYITSRFFWINQIIKMKFKTLQYKNYAVMKSNISYFIKNLLSLWFYLATNFCSVPYLITVMLWAVDWSTIQIWTIFRVLLSKTCYYCHVQQSISIGLLNTNQDTLLLNFCPLRGSTNY